MMISSDSFLSRVADWHRHADAFAFLTESEAAVLLLSCSNVSPQGWRLDSVATDSTDASSDASVGDGGSGSDNTAAAAVTAAEATAPRLSLLVRSHCCGRTVAIDEGTQSRLLSHSAALLASGALGAEIAASLANEEEEGDGEEDGSGNKSTPRPPPALPVAHFLATAHSDDCLWIDITVTTALLLSPLNPRQLTDSWVVRGRCAAVSLSLIASSPNNHSHYHHKDGSGCGAAATGIAPTRKVLLPRGTAPSVMKAAVDAAYRACFDPPSDRAVAAGPAGDDERSEMEAEPQHQKQQQRQQDYSYASEAYLSLTDALSGAEREPSPSLVYTGSSADPRILNLFFSAAGVPSSTATRPRPRHRKRQRETDYDSGNATANSTRTYNRSNDEDVAAAPEVALSSPEERAQWYLCLLARMLGLQWTPASSGDEGEDEGEEEAGKLYTTDLVAADIDDQEQHHYKPTDDDDDGDDNDDVSPSVRSSYFPLARNQSHQHSHHNLPQAELDGADGGVQASADLTDAIGFDLRCAYCAATPSLRVERTTVEEEEVEDEDEPEGDSCAAAAAVATESEHPDADEAPVPTPTTPTGDHSPKKASLVPRARTIVSRTTTTTVHHVRLDPTNCSHCTCCPWRHLFLDALLPMPTATTATGGGISVPGRDMAFTFEVLDSPAGRREASLAAAAAAAQQEEEEERNRQAELTEEAAVVAAVAAQLVPDGSSDPAASPSDAQGDDQPERDEEEEKEEAAEGTDAAESPCDVDGTGGEEPAPRSSGSTERWLGDDEVNNENEEEEKKQFRAPTPSLSPGGCDAPEPTDRDPFVEQEDDAEEEERCDNDGESRASSNHDDEEGVNGLPFSQDRGHPDHGHPTNTADAVSVSINRASEEEPTTPRIIPRHLRRHVFTHSLCVHIDTATVERLITCWRASLDAQRRFPVQYLLHPLPDIVLCPPQPFSVHTTHTPTGIGSGSDSGKTGCKDTSSVEAFLAELAKRETTTTMTTEAGGRHRHGPPPCPVAASLFHRAPDNTAEAIALLAAKALLVLDHPITVTTTSSGSSSALNSTSNDADRAAVLSSDLHSLLRDGVALLYSTETRSDGARAEKEAPERERAFTSFREKMAAILPTFASEAADATASGSSSSATQQQRWRHVAPLPASVVAELITALYGSLLPSVEFTQATERAATTPLASQCDGTGKQPQQQQPLSSTQIFIAVEPLTPQQQQEGRTAETVAADRQLVAEYLESMRRGTEQVEAAAAKAAAAAAVAAAKAPPPAATKPKAQHQPPQQQTVQRQGGQQASPHNSNIRPQPQHPQHRGGPVVGFPASVRSQQQQQRHQPQQYHTHSASAGLPGGSLAAHASPVYPGNAGRNNSIIGNNAGGGGGGDGGLLGFTAAALPALSRSNAPPQPTPLSGGGGGSVLGGGLAPVFGGPSLQGRGRTPVLAMPLPQHQQQQQHQQHQQQHARGPTGSIFSQPLQGVFGAAPTVAVTVGHPAGAGLLPHMNNSSSSGMSAGGGGGRVNVLSASVSRSGSVFARGPQQQQPSVVVGQSNLQQQQQGGGGGFRRGGGGSGGRPRDVSPPSRRGGRGGGGGGSRGGGGRGSGRGSAFSGRR